MWDALKVCTPLHNVGAQQGSYILPLQHRASNLSILDPLSQCGIKEPQKDGDSSSGTACGMYSIRGMLELQTSHYTHPAESTISVEPSVWSSDHPHEDV